MSWIVSPPKHLFWDLNPSTLNTTLCWNQVFSEVMEPKRGHQGEPRSSKTALLAEGGSWDTDADAHTQKTTTRREKPAVCRASTTQGTPGAPANDKSRRGRGRVPLRSPPRSVAPPTPWFQTSRLRNGGTKNSCWDKAPQCTVLSCSGPGKQIQTPMWLLA